MNDKNSKRFVESADKLKISYSVRGNGETTLLFIHCWLGNQSFWNQPIAALQHSYTTVTLDLGGHGASGKTRRAWSIPAFADDVEAVLSQLESPHILLVAHSMGGPVALEVAKRAPERIAAIVFVDTLHDMDLKPTPEQFDAMMEPFRRDYLAAVRQAFASRLAPPPDLQLLDWLLEQAQRVAPAVGIGAMEGMGQYDVRTAAKEAAMPLRAINGSLRTTNRAANRRLLRDYDLLVIEGAGHFPYLEKPDEFNAGLQDTLKGLGF